ncbi:MAG: RNA polymerase sigma factor SigF [Firmicutes bacterium ADurb.Bin356]|nr:MAG: RNA polymerase sigma factor SigF [Firmicutes bacterium ADurb.Bin356]
MLVDAIAHEALLQKYCKTRNLELRNELLEHYLFIAEIAAKKFVGRGVDYDDLFQVASLALIRALERFDCSREIKFGSFATPSVIGEIKNYFRDRSRTIRLPRRMTEMMKKFYEAEENFINTNGRSPQPDELASELNVSIENIYELIEAKSNMQMLSIDETVPVQDGMRSLADVLGEESEAYLNIENADFVNRSLSSLTTQEREIIIMRYVRRKSQRAVAEIMGVSQMYISRLERRVLAKLRELILKDN